MRNFRTLTIWKNGIEFAKKVINLAQRLPSSEKYGLASQISRASVSIPSNIAEGCSRKSYKEIARFLEISLGSAFELETQLIIIRQMSWIPDTEIQSLLSDLTILQKQINSYRNTPVIPHFP